MVTRRRRWTATALERACRDALLQRSSVRMGRLPLSRVAEVTWERPDGHAKMVVDNHGVGIRPAVVHELLHIVLADWLDALDDDLEETIVNALETRLDTQIKLSRRRVAWWRKNVQKQTRKP